MKKKPMRRCLGCYQMKMKDKMIRIVKTKENEIFIDRTRKANGRGAYICPHKECLEAAINNKRLSNSLKTSINSDIYNELREELDDRK